MANAKSGCQHRIALENYMLRWGKHLYEDESSCKTSLTLADPVGVAGVATPPEIKMNKLI